VVATPGAGQAPPGARLNRVALSSPGKCAVRTALRYRVSRIRRMAAEYRIWPIPAVVGALFK